MRSSTPTVKRVRDKMKLTGSLAAMDITLNPMKMEIMDKKANKQWPPHQRNALTISPKLDYFTKSPELFVTSISQRI
jgi:hypothetical protein